MPVLPWCVLRPSSAAAEQLGVPRLLLYFWIRCGIAFIAADHIVRNGCIFVAFDSQIGMGTARGGWWATEEPVIGLFLRLAHGHVRRLRLRFLPFWVPSRRPGTHLIYR